MNDKNIEKFEEKMDVVFDKMSIFYKVLVGTIFISIPAVTFDLMPSLTALKLVFSAVCLSSVATLAGYTVLGVEMRKMEKKEKNNDSTFLEVNKDEVIKENVNTLNDNKTNFLSNKIGSEDFALEDVKESPKCLVKTFTKK